MFKFDINQHVFYLNDNTLHSAPINSRKIVENSHVKHPLARPFGEDKVAYSTIHGVFNEEEIFESKEALIAHLISNE